MLSRFDEYSSAYDLQKSFVRELSDSPDRGLERKPCHLSYILPSMGDLLNFAGIHFTRKPQNDARNTLLGGWRGQNLNGSSIATAVAGNRFPSIAGGIANISPA